MHTHEIEHARSYEYIYARASATRTSTRMTHTTYANLFTNDAGTTPCLGVSIGLTSHFPEYLRHYDESSECETARQHKVAEVACYRLERTLMGCTDPFRRGVGAPHRCSRVSKTRSGWWEFVTYKVADVAFNVD